MVERLLFPVEIVERLKFIYPGNQKQRAETLQIRLTIVIPIRKYERAFD